VKRRNRDLKTGAMTVNKIGRLPAGNQAEGVKKYGTSHFRNA